MAPTATSRRMQLGNELRRFRTSNKLTQQQVANVLGCTQGKINKIESGTTGVKIGDLRKLLDTYGVTGDEAETLLNMARNSAAMRGQWSGYRSAVPHWFRMFTDLEPAASEILSFHGERIPGSIQSEHYMLKQFSSAGRRDVEWALRNRMERRAVFEQKQPPYYRFILGEGALRRCPGGPDPAVMLDQIEFLQEMNRRERVYIHLLPFDCKLPAMPNDFTIMRFTDTTRDMVYLEHSAGSVQIDDTDSFHNFVDTWDRVRGAALERQDTQLALKEIAESYRSKMYL